MSNIRNNVFAFSKAPTILVQSMVRSAPLPAWAALVVEAARRLPERGWLGSQRSDCPAAAECSEHPACAPLLTCPEATATQLVGLTLVAAVAGAGCGYWLSLRHTGRARSAPSRHRGGVVG